MEKYVVNLNLEEVYLLTFQSHRPYFTSRYPRQYGIGNCSISARFYYPAEGFIPEDKGLQET
jgi:hypothetical protein